VQKHGGGRRAEWGARWKFGTTKTKFHPQFPEELYEDPNIPGLYTGWWRRVSHFIRSIGKKGGFIECAGDKCVTCALTHPDAEEFQHLGIEEPDKALQKAEDMNVSYVVAGIIEEWFHLVEEVNPKTGKKYLERQICEGKTCKMCRKHGTDTRVFGRRVYTEFSWGAWNYEIAPALELAEKHCKCGGSIYIPEYVCAQCGEILIDVANTCEVCAAQGREHDPIEIDVSKQEATCPTCRSTWSLLEAEEDSLRNAVNEKYECACGHVGYAQPRLYCTNCESPDPHGLEDMQLVIKKESDAQQAKTKLVDWDIKPLDEMLFDPKWQGAFPGASQDEVQWAEKAAERNNRPINLEVLFPTESTAQQAKKLGVADPFGDEEDAVRTRATPVDEDY
jgi:hypothetical protein